MKNKYNKLIILGIYLILFISFKFINKNSKSKLNDESKLLSNDETVAVTNVENEEYENSETELEEIYVHISGEVKFPGLVKLNRGQRLYEAIEIAGGLTDDADIDQINLSLVLNDQDKIYVPKKGEIVSPASSEISEYVNINTATKEELMTLSGIGEKTAEKIIKYRENNHFDKIEDIMNVPGIGESKFNEIKDEIKI